MTVRQDGQMPSPVVLKVQFAATGPAIKPMANAKMVDDTTAIVTWPVDVWFNGSRTFQAVLDFGGRADHHDHARSRLPLPRSRSRRQRLAEGRRRHSERPRRRRRLERILAGRLEFSSLARQPLGRSGVHDIQDISVRILEPRRSQLPGDVNVSLPCHTRQIVMLELDAFRLQVAHDIIHPVADVP